MPRGQTDHARRKRLKRYGREKGGWIYIPSEALEAVGIDPNGDAPWYRTWAGPKRKSPTVLVQLYDEP